MISVPVAELLPDPEYRPRLSIGERREHGRAIRARVPHERHGT
jgi:hypothetical protein